MEGIKTLSLKEKLTGLVNSLLDDSAIPAMYRPVIKNLVGSYLKNANDDEVRVLLAQLKDQILPWLLS